MSSTNKHKLRLGLIVRLTVSGEEHIDVSLVESPVTSRTYAVRLQYAPVIPSPHRVNMHVEKPSYLSRR
jgi:Flp pilus assembly secretin CpaC